MNIEVKTEIKFEVNKGGTYSLSGSINGETGSLSLAQHSSFSHDHIWLSKDTALELIETLKAAYKVLGDKDEKAGDHS